MPILAILAAIGGVLASLLVGGLIGYLIVRIAGFLFDHIKKRISERRKKVAVTKIKGALDAFEKQQTVQQRQECTMKADDFFRAHGIETVAAYGFDETGNVDKDSIEIIEGNQVDDYTKGVINTHGGHIVIDPMMA